MLYFVFAVALLVFVAGIAVGHYKWPPYGFLKQALYAGQDLWWWLELKVKDQGSSHPHVIAMQERRPSIAADGQRLYPGATAVTLYTDRRFGVVLLDRDNKMLHQWKIPEEVLDRLIASEAWSMDKSHYTIHGTHVFENGDVVFNVEGTALVRIDKCSNLLWMLAEPTHHSVYVDEEGVIWVPSKRTVSDPARAFTHMTTPYEEHLILRVSGDGKVLETISVLEAIYEGKYQGVLLAGSQHYPQTTEFDPTHLNDLEIIGEAFAEKNEFAEPGDILISMRTIDTVAILDRNTKVMKWAMTGAFLRQHDPDALPNGNLLIFDNRTDKGQHNQAKYHTKPQSFGYSRIIEIDPRTQKIVWEYTGTEAQPLYTSIQGKQQWLPNGNVLITETEGGRVLEVTRDSNEIVWQFENVVGPGDNAVDLGRITDATRIPLERLTFIGTQCDGPDYGAAMIR